MAILQILQYPDERLHTIAKPVFQVDDATREVVKNMAHTMYAAPGVGLAASQIDVHEQIIVVDISEEHNQLRVFINPEILSKVGELTAEEGCLSVPGIYEDVCRAEKIIVRALDLQGVVFTLEVEGFLAVCIQHEIDHLQGRLFVEYLSKLKQTRLRSKLKKRRREAL
ncbi:MAG: peptide deformylase [Gallionella sp.]